MIILAAQRLCRSFPVWGFIPPCSRSMGRILNVAEKNDAAKCLADIMSRGGFRKREGFSKFNKIYEFDYHIFNKNCTMTMTSVSGHLLNYEFVVQYRKWYSCSPVTLFEAPVQKCCPQDYNDIKRTLEREVRGCEALIVWTDCDREGENIGFEVIQVCKEVKPNIRLYRARFSEITPGAIQRALAALQEPDQLTSDAVDVRQELDLRIGAAFTRFQTLRLQKVFPDVLAEQLISYGSCQFPTLGFVVERYKQVQAFVAEPFWKIKVSHSTDEGLVEFNWKRQRLFDHVACLVLYQHCLENPLAEVVDIRSRPKSRWRPAALDTVELEKLASRKMRINAKETMKIAEKLYTQGFISYPRTETNIFPKDMDLDTLVQQQTRSPAWGTFAENLLVQGLRPRNGNKTDQAHPPIHPTKYTDSLHGNEQKVYEFVVRHFLACCSQDAQGQETTVEIDINGESFSAQGLMILAKNYLEVYPYDKWTAKVIPTFNVGEIFQPKTIEMNQSETSAPPLLTEADLIALMDKHGIGTDATHADHIETIKSRLYVGVRDDGRFVPGELGMGLVDGYDSMGFEMSKPNLRAELEADLKRICQGTRDKDVVLAEQVSKYKQVFEEASRQASKIDEALSEYFGAARPYAAQAFQNAKPVRKCHKCGADIIIKSKKDGKGFFLSCTGYPDCREAVWFPEFVLEACVSDEICNNCQPGPVYKVKFKFKRGSVPPYIPLDYVGCATCDSTLSEVMEACGYSFTRNSTQSSGVQNRPPAGNNGSFSSQASSIPSTSRTQRPALRGNDKSGQAPKNSRSFTTGGASQTARPLSTVNTPRMMGTLPGGRGAGIGVNAARGHRGRGSDRGGVVTSGFSGGNARMNSTSGMDDSLDRMLSSLDDGGEGNSVVCSCGDDARLLTVRKEGPNTGRQFYSCPKPQDASCGFFLWADTPPDDGGNSGGGNSGGGGASNWGNNQSYQRDTGPSFGNSAGGSGGVTCGCGTQAKELTVHKEGPNKGRPFHVCSKPRDQGCGFFQWADEDPGSAHVGRGGQGGGRGRGRGGSVGGTRGSGRGRGAAEPGGPKKKRRCTVCGEEGHNRKKCPQS